VVVNPKLVGVGDLVYLFNRFEAEVVCLELVCEAGGLGVELVRDVPDTRGKLKYL